MAGTLGTFKPKIIEPSVPTTIEFDYSVLKKFNMEYNTINNQNLLNGNRNHFNLGKSGHLVIEFAENLWKYGDPEGKAEDIRDELFKEVEFYFDKDTSNYIADLDDLPVMFYFAGWKRFFIEESTWQDGVMLTFKSTQPVALIKEVVEYLVTDEDDYIVTDGGDKILINR